MSPTEALAYLRAQVEEAESKHKRRSDDIGSWCAECYDAEAVNSYPCDAARFRAALKVAVDALEGRRGWCFEHGYDEGANERALVACAEALKGEG